MLAEFLQFLLQNQTFFIVLGIVVVVALILLEIESINFFKIHALIREEKEILTELDKLFVSTSPFTCSGNETCRITKPPYFITTTTATAKGMKGKVLAKVDGKEFYITHVSAWYATCGRRPMEKVVSKPSGCLIVPIQGVRRGKVIESVKGQTCWNI